MSRYIDADKLKQLRDNVISGKLDIKTESDLIDACPTEDVIKVVRCKDCINRIEFDTNKFHCELTGYYCGETGYCSDGVHKKKE